MRLPQTDKVAHAGVGAILAALVLPVGGLMPAVGVSWFVGAIKEGADWLANRKSEAANEPAYHHVEGLDFLATGLGGTAMAGWLSWWFDVSFWP